MVKTKIRNPKVEEDNYQDFEPESDEMGRRQIVAEDESFTIIQSDRYALWSIKRDGIGGPLPKQLEGQYTSVHAAEQAIKVYVGQKAEQKKV